MRLVVSEMAMIVYVVQLALVAAAAVDMLPSTYVGRQLGVPCVGLHDFEYDGVKRSD